MPPKRKAPTEPFARRKKQIINHAPSERLNVYVFGEGGSGELGLGTAKKAKDVKRPRLNPFLLPDRIGVVQVSSGGMHVVALTQHNTLLTWGVNDQGALGRSTVWEGGLRDLDESEDSDDEADDNGLNPHESTPGEVDWSQTKLPKGTTFSQVAAGDSCSLALTSEGHVYGWGTFRSNEGATNFTPAVDIAPRPILIDVLKNIIQIDTGSNHALAIDNKGTVFTWGSHEQDQLGRRLITTRRSKGKENLIPSAINLPKGPKNGIASVHAGPYHNFALSKNGSVYGWGLNNMGETGIMDNAGKDGATIPNPRIVESLKDKQVVSLGCGSHHSIAATKNGDCLAWGRMDGCQAGISNDDLAKLPPEYTIKDEHNRPRILAVPQKVTAINGAVKFVTASSEHNLAVTREGKAYSWGFSANYQTGQGTTDDIEVATLIDNTAIHNKVVNVAASGGQYGILTSVAGTEIKN